MRKIKFSLFCSAVFLSLAGMTSSMYAAASSEALVHGFAAGSLTGPGLQNLSIGDEYAPYQWGLKNDGTLHLTELQNNFQSVKTPDNTGSADLNDISIPAQPEPSDFESVVIPAEKGIDINISPAWEVYDNAGSLRNVAVAIIDTGVDFTHVDLQNSIWQNPGEIHGDGIDNDGNGYIDDVIGWNFYNNNNQVFTGYEDYHGTHSAGTVAASRGAYGTAGIANSHFVKIMPLKALGGVHGTGSVSSIIEAIKYAEANGASICNLSLGTSVYDEQLAQTIRDSKMLFIIASGNGDASGYGFNTDIFPVYPASLPYDNIISVANLMFDGSLAKNSNFGYVSVDIAAPGSYIVSTLPGNNYAFMSGTSMAAPMVTGVAAMLYSYYTEASLSDVRSMILNSAKKLDSLSGKISTGGMLDAYAAITYMQRP